MSEMLANQYFLSRRFDAAMPVYEKLIGSPSYNEKIAKKLIVCYSVTDALDKAFQIFYDLIRQNPLIISDTKFYEDDCPCPEIIPQILSGDLVYKNQEEKNLALAMLYLYCDVNDSLEYFKKLKNSTIIEKKLFEEAITIISKIKPKPKSN